MTGVRRFPCTDDEKAILSLHRHFTGIGDHASPILESSQRGGILIDRLSKTWFVNPLGVNMSAMWSETCEPLKENNELSGCPGEVSPPRRSFAGISANHSHVKRDHRLSQPPSTFMTVPLR
jgi:hypothetical protein